MDESSAVVDLGVDFQRDLVTAEMKAGDVLLLNNLIPHRYGVCVWGGIHYSMPTHVDILRHAPMQTYCTTRIVMLHVSV